MNKDKLIPELRFPEFMNEGEWEEVELGKLKLDVSDGNYSSKYPSQSDFLKSGVPFIRSNNLKNGTVVDKDMRFISEKQHSEITKGHLKEGDILLSTRGELGTVALVPKKHIGSNINAQLVRINTSNILVNIFLFYLLELSRLNKIFDLLSTGTALKQLPIGKLNQLKLLLPKNKREQQKIASCLSSLDEVIAAHSQKLALLKDHKKGLMQNLFPQEGDASTGSAVPKYRFKEFEKDGEWVEKKLGEVFSFLVTNSYSRENLNYENGQVKNIHYGDIHTKFSTLFDITKEKVPFINMDIPIERIRQECYCKEGDLIFADASEDLDDIGKCIEIVNLNSEKLVPGLHTLMARQKENLLVVGFGGYLFKSGLVRQQIQKESQGTKVLSISTGRISDITIIFPKNPKEQQKIASCLSSLDALITAQAEKIEQLKLHKKGLMQGLFPKIND
ncbi:MAG: restriction endonuclease subunit S [Bacteroidales bacterium]